MATSLPFVADVKALVEKEHRTIQAGDLGRRIRTATYYNPRRPNHENDVFLLEVIDNFGEGVVSLPLFEIHYNWDEDKSPDQLLCLILCSPEEFAEAARQDADQVRELLQAIERGEAEFLYGGSPFNVFAEAGAK